MNSVTQGVIRKALNDFHISGSSPLNGTGGDATDEILPEIYAISTLLEMGFRRGSIDGGDESALENANPELVASALSGVARLAALALFASNQRGN